MLGIKYGCKESIEMTRKIYRALAVGSHTSSCVMAKERGAFPIFDYKLEKDHAYLKASSRIVLPKFVKCGRLVGAEILL